MKNNLTFGQLDRISLAQAGNLNQDSIDILLRQVYVNTKLMRIYRWLDGVNDPWYNKPTILTVAADQEFLKDVAQGGTITAMIVSGSTITLTRSSGLFIAGSMITVTLVSASTGSILNQCLARITTGGLVAIATIISGTMITYAAQHVSVVVTKSLSTLTADISDIYFKNIVRITDQNYTIVPGVKTRVFTRYEDSELFANLSIDPMKEISVGYYHRGTTIEFFVGSRANALGVVTCEYRGKPSLWTDATVDNEVDIPPEDNMQLIDEVTACYAIDQKKDVPPDVASRLVAYQKDYESVEADATKKTQKENT